MSVNNLLAQRIVYDVLIVLCVYLMPAWSNFCLILLGFIVFDFFLEGVGAAIAIDVLYAPLAGTSLSTMKVAGISLAVFLIFEFFIKKFMRMYQS